MPYTRKEENFIGSAKFPFGMHYGNTCSKCPSRGCRDIVGDFAPSIGSRPIQVKQTMFIDNTNLELTNVSHEPTVQWEPVGYPIRCRTCNARYNAYKRAAEAVERLEIIRATLTGAKWKYLKFVTMTWPIEPTDNEAPDISGISKKYLDARNHLIEKIEVLGGTGVMEVVSQFGVKNYVDKRTGETKQKGVAGKWTHNVHFHDLWLSPYIENDRLQDEFLKAGVGRFEYTVLREEEYVGFNGEDRVMAPHKVAIQYLSKYLTKCSGAKRKVFGVLRKWKEYLHEDLCGVCIKTTHDIRKEHPCKCETKGASKEQSQDS